MSAFSGSTLCLAQTLRDVDPLWISKEQVRHGYDACIKKRRWKFLNDLHDQDGICSYSMLERGGMNCALSFKAAGPDL